MVDLPAQYKQVQVMIVPAEAMGGLTAHFVNSPMTSVNEEQYLPGS